MTDGPESDHAASASTTLSGAVGAGQLEPRDSDKGNTILFMHWL